MLAADMRAGLPAVVTDRVDQRAPGLDANLVILSVDIEREIDLFRHAPCSARQPEAPYRPANAAVHRGSCNGATVGEDAENYADCSAAPRLAGGRSRPRWSRSVGPV